MIQPRSIDVREALLLGGLIAAALAGWARSVASNSPTYDECGHIVSGIYHWQTGQFDSYAVNPPLPRLVQTVFLAGRQIDPDGVRDPNAGRDGWRREWPLAEHVLRVHGNRFFDWLPWARMMNLLFLAVGYGCCLAILNHCLAPSERSARAAGRLALTLLYFGDPLLMGYAAFAMPETASAAAGPLATLLLLRDWQERSLGSAVAAGLGGGLALAVKTTWLVGLPLWASAVLIARLHARSDAERPLTAAIRRSLGACTAFLMTAWFALCLSYGFDEVGVALADFSFVAEPLAGPLVHQVQQSAWGSLPVPLPAWFVRGIDLQKYDFLPRFSSYFVGAHRWYGWPEYYLAVGLYRWPIAWLGLLAPSAAAAVVRLRGAQRLIWMTPLALLVFLSIHHSFTNHFRYLVPAFPFLHLMIALLVAQVSRRLRPASLGLLLVGFAQTLAWAPNQVGYVNLIDRLLPREYVYGLAPVDSSIDYGQNLFALREWLDNHPEVELHGAALSHFPELQAALDLDCPAPPSMPTAGDVQKSGGTAARWYAFDIRSLYDLHHRRYDGLLNVKPATVIRGSVYVYRIPPKGDFEAATDRPFVLDDDRFVRPRF